MKIIKNHDITEINILKKKFSLYTNKLTFRPTGTTNLLIKSIAPIISKDKKKSNLLDLGTGSGVVAIALSNIRSNFNFFASDLSRPSCKLAELNSKHNNKNIIIKHGSLFSPWKNYKFDYIVNDVSGISSKLARLSNWFENVPSDSGIDGTKLSLRIINQSVKHLSDKGIFFFPLLSLSNEKKILLNLKLKFKNISIIGSQEWVMPTEFTNNNKMLLSDLKNKNYINYNIKFGIYTWKTDIYALSNNISFD